MPLMLNRESQDTSLEIIRAICLEWLFPGISETQRSQLKALVERMYSSQEDMRVTCVFESVGNEVKIEVKISYPGTMQ